MEMEYSLKEKLIPANNVAFVLCIWKGEGVYSLKQYISI